VLHLNSRVHLDEHVLPRSSSRNSTVPAQVYPICRREGDGVGADPFAQLRIQIGRRRQLDDLLVAPLQRAVPFEEVDDVALRVGEDLHFDVRGLMTACSRKTVAIAERRLRFPRCGLDRFLQVEPVRDAPHPASTASRDGLDEHRELIDSAAASSSVDIVDGSDDASTGSPALAAGDGAGLVPGQLQHLGRRPDEG
jgi:hypothetical protein